MLYGSGTGRMEIKKVQWVSVTKLKPGCSLVAMHGASEFCVASATSSSRGRFSNSRQLHSRQSKQPLVLRIMLGSMKRYIGKLKL